MPDTDLILVSGATGTTGSGVASSLLAKGCRVRALVRDEAKAAGLREQGAQIAVADLDRPETLTGDLLDGVTGVYFLTWNGPTALQQSRNPLEAIKRSGQRRTSSACPVTPRRTAASSPSSPRARTS